MSESRGKYISGAAPEPVTCQLTLKNKELFIFRHQQPLLIWNLTSVTLQHDGIMLRINNGEDQILCSEPLASEILALTSSKNSGERRRRFNWYYSALLIAFLFISGLIVCAYVYLMPWLAEKAVVLFPETQEVELGKRLSQVYAITAKNDSSEFYANRFLHQLRIETEYPLHVRIIPSKELNAFALPGGEIFVYSAMIEKMNGAGELAALLSHEASHVIKRHSLKMMFRSAASGLVLSAIFGDASGIAGWMASQADQFRELHFSRSMESEADKNGILLLRKSGIGPHCMLDLLDLLRRESEQMPEVMKYLSTHPATDDRMTEVKKLIGGNSVYKPNPEMEKDFQKLKSMVMETAKRS